MKSILMLLLGIIRHEMRFQWRRRALLIIGASFGLLLLFALLAQRAVIRSQGDSGNSISAEATTFAVTLSVSTAGLIVMMVGLPPVLAETIPKDKQYNVHELIGSLPVTTGLYLAGKTAGVWASVLFMLLLVAGADWIMSRLLLGPIILNEYLELWLLGIVPLALFTSGMSVLLASQQPSRRRATMVGAAYTLYSILMLPLFAKSDLTWLNSFEPSAWLLVVLRGLFRQIGSGLAGTEFEVVFPVATNRFVWQTILASLVQLACIWLLVSWWGRRQAMKD